MQVEIFSPFHLLNFMESNRLELLGPRLFYIRLLCIRHKSSSLFQCPFKCLMTRSQNNGFVLLKRKGRKEKGGRETRA